MNDQQISDMETKLDSLEKFMTNRNRRLSKIARLCANKLIAEPQGFISKRCPRDNTKLTKSDGGWEYKWYCCPNCDYEYVTRNNFDI